MKRSLFIILVSFSVAASAQVFQRAGPDGEASFSDQPGDDTTPVDVAPAQAINLPPVPEQSDAAAQTDDAPAPYTEFSVVSPTAEQEVRANDGNVTVQLSLQPALMPGHGIVLSVDGEDGNKLTSGDAMTVELSNLSRGRHSVSATVVDDTGKALIEAGSVSFNVLRAAVGG